MLFLPLLLLSLASALPPPESYPDQAFLSTPSPRANITAPLFATFSELSKLNDISYCVGFANTGITHPFTCLSYCSAFPTFELIQTWNTGLAFSDSCGFIALSHAPAKKRIIVAFRGTYSITNAIADLSFARHEYAPYPSAEEDECEGCQVHMGFLQSWDQTQKIIGDVLEKLVDVYPEYELVLIGHSLGGAVATLAGLDFVARGWSPVVTTFGEPKLGNAELASYIETKFTPATFRRVTHINDPVPLLPPDSLGYRSHGFEYYISAQSLPYNHTDVHPCFEDGGECVEDSGSVIGVLQNIWAHRDYFHRMGLCVPPDSAVGKWGDGEPVFATSEGRELK